MIFISKKLKRIQASWQAVTKCPYNLINVALKEGTGIYYKEPSCVPKYAFLKNLHLGYILKKHTTKNQKY